MQFYLQQRYIEDRFNISGVLFWISQTIKGVLLWQCEDKIDW